MRRRALSIATVLVLVGACSGPGASGGSGTSPTGAASASDSGQTITIGLVTEAWDNPAIKDLADAAIAEAAKDPNVKLLAQDSSNLQDEIAKIETLISQDVDALGIEPWDAKAMIPTLEKAKNAGIPVFILQSVVPGAAEQGLVTSSIMGDEVAGGKIAGTWLGNALGGNGRVAIIEGAPADTPGVERANGVEEGLKAFPGIEVVARQPADWARDKALTVATNILTANPDINAIFADNDEMAFGAVSALKAAKLDDKVIVVGYNGTCIGLNATYEGVFAGDGILFLDHVGSAFIDAALKTLNKETVEQRIAPAITFLSTENVKKIHEGATTVDVNGEPFQVDALLKTRVDNGATNNC